MGTRVSKQTTVTSYALDFPELTPVAETTQAQIYCRSEALQSNSSVPEAEKYIVRPKSGLCIQAKPRKYNGKVYYVVGMGKKTNAYINLKLEGGASISENSVLQQTKTEALVVPNTTIVTEKKQGEEMARTLEEFVKSNPNSPDVKKPIAEYEPEDIFTGPSKPVSTQRILAQVSSAPHLPSPADPAPLEPPIYPSDPAHLEFPVYPSDPAPIEPPVFPADQPPSIEVRLASEPQEEI